MIFKWLKSLLGFIDSSTPSGHSADADLLAASEQGDDDEIQWLLQAGASVNAVTNQQKLTPLHLAVRGDYPTCVELLLQHPLVDLEAEDRWGRTPLHTAAVWQRLHLLRCLLEHDQDLINKRDGDGKSLLHYACASGSVNFVKFLIENKADLNVTDHRKWTPLMSAVSVQSVDIVRQLLEHGAKCDQPTTINCCTHALQLAIEKHNLEIVNLLLKHGALVEYTFTVAFGSLAGYHRHSSINHNLATTAIEKVDLKYPHSIEIARRVLQATPTAPDEEACLKLYEQYIKPTKRLRRSMSRELVQLIESISDSTVSDLTNILKLSFAVGADLSKSNVDRLKRKFHLDDKLDYKFFELLSVHYESRKSLKLQSILVIRKRLIDSGQKNVFSAVNSSNLPNFLKDLILLDWW